jgi:hypothetical protein
MSNPAPVVAHHDGVTSIRLRFSTDVDRRLRSLPRVLPGIRQQVLKDHTNQPRIAGRRERRVERDLHLTVAIAGAQTGNDLFRNGREVDRLRNDGRARHSCPPQQILDQGVHVLSRRHDAPEIALRLRGERHQGVPLQKIGAPVTDACWDVVASPPPPVRC